MQKKILGRTLSPKTSDLVSSMEATFRFPVEYYSISAMPNKSRDAHGTVDPFGSNGQYKVWLSLNLTDERFETNLLHELTHIVQIEQGYPCVCNKDSADYHSPDRSFVESLGSRLGSAVLDVDVQERLLEDGYSNCEFAEENAAGLIGNSDHDYTRLDDPLNYAIFVTSLLLTASLVGEATREDLYAAYNRYPPVVNDVRFLYDEMRRIGASTPERAAASLGAIIDRLSLWPYYFILLKGRRIRTRNEYVAFLQECN